MKEITRRSATVRWWDPRNPMWWFMAVAIVGGVYVLVDGLAHAVSLYPLTGVLALVLSVPMFVLVWFLVRGMQIVTRVGKSAAIAAVVWGGIVATGVYAINANGAIIQLLAQHVSLDFANAWGAAIAAPITEETGKLLGVVAVVVAARSWLRGPMDGLLIGALVGLGFALTENALYAFNVTSMSFGESQAVATLAIYFMRTLLFWPISHAIFTGLAGAGLGFLLGRPAARSRLWGVLCLAGAWGLHFAWNSPLLPGLLARMAFATLVPFVLWAVIHRARRSEAAWVRVALVDDVAAGTVPSAWASGLAGTLRGRRRTRKELVRLYGPAAKPAQRSLEGLLVDLADAIDAGDDADAAQLRARAAALAEQSRLQAEHAAAEAERQQAAWAEYYRQLEEYRRYWAERGYRV